MSEITKAVEVVDNVEPTYTTMALFAGSWSELDVFDFSQLNLRFVKFRSEEFTTLIKEVEFFEGQLTKFTAELEDQHLDLDRFQALVPIDFSQPVDKGNIWLVRNILLIIFPSDITVNTLVRLQLIDSKVALGVIEGYNFLSTGENIFGNYLVHYDHEIESVNAFIPIFIERHNQITYLQSTIDSYLSSYFQNFTNMEFLSLCIAMESIVDGKTELIYRIRRNLSILLTDQVDFGKNIFKNIGEIYELRSAIVHSSTVRDEKFKEYLPYLRKVISRLIVELVSLNIKDLTTLNAELTVVGYGDRNKLSEDYIEYELSSGVHSYAVAHELTKYRK